MYNVAFVDFIVLLLMLVYQIQLNSMIEIIRHEIGKFYCIWKEKQKNIDMDTEMLHIFPGIFIYYSAYSI